MKRRWRLVAAIGYAILVLLLVEGCSRVYWKISRDVPMRSPGEIVYGFYPELESVNWFRPTKDDGVFDILILGGSVMTYPWGNVKQLLLERATYESGRPVHVHNLARPGHSTRDSFYKYRYLRDDPFDLVLLYHGLNDVRANNCPPSVFSRDYSQYSWYEAVGKLSRHPEVRFVLLPFTIDFLWTSLKELFDPVKDSRMAAPRSEWISYGSDIKTSVTFRENLSAFIEIAAAKEEDLLLMTYATYVPENYSEKAFEEKRLDYTLHKAKIELWGDPINVMAGVAAHNAVVESIVEDNPDVSFVDQDGLISKDGEHFNDICHFTHKGCEEFVENIWPVVRRTMEAWAEENTPPHPSSPR